MFPSSSKSASELLLSLVSVKQSDRVSIEEDVLFLFDQHQAGLLRYALSFGLSLEDGQDVIQDTFLSLFRHLQDEKSRENLPGWLFRVTHNLALKRRVKHRNEVSLFDPLRDREIELPGTWLTPEEQVLQAERQSRLQACLNVLPEMDRQCLLLRAEGLKYRDIASVLGISLGSVASRLARAFERLQRTDR